MHVESRAGRTRHGGSAKNLSTEKQQTGFIDMHGDMCASGATAAPLLIGSSFSRVGLCGSGGEPPW